MGISFTFNLNECYASKLVSMFTYSPPFFVLFFYLTSRDVEFLVDMVAVESVLILIRPTTPNIVIILPLSLYSIDANSVVK